METMKQTEVTTSIRKVIDGFTISTIPSDITSGIAQALLNRGYCKALINKNTIKHFVTILNEGRWVFDGDPIRLDDKGKILNGLHRLLAIVETGITKPLVVISGMDPETFPIIDGHRKRNAPDVLHIMGVPNAQCAAASIKSIYNIRNGGLLKSNLRSLDNPSLLNYYFDELEGLDESVTLGRRLYITFMKALSETNFATFHYLFSEKDPEMANEFFEQLATGVGFEEGSPIYVLRNKLLKAKRNANRGVTQKLPPKEVKGLLILAWNKFRANKPCKRLSVPEDFDYVIAD